MIQIRGIAATIAIVLGAYAAEARDLREEHVYFAAGQQSVELRDQIIGYESVSYHVHGIAGETLSVTLKTPNTSTYFNIYEPGSGPGDKALAVSEFTGPRVPDINVFKDELKHTGDYIISVYMVRAAARRNEVSSFALDVALEGGPVVETAEEDQAMRFGPDHWIVDVNSRLRVHSQPSSASPLIGYFLPGTALRNLGCQHHDTHTWCEVERPNGQNRGWVAAEYLRSSNRPLPASDEKSEVYGHSHGWNILVSKDRNLGCLAEVERNGVQVQIGLDRRDMSTYFAIFTKDRIGAQEGQHLAARFHLDGDIFYADVHEENRGGYEGGYVHINNPAFLTDLADAHDLAVYAGGNAPIHVDLTGSKRAIGRVLDCQMHQ